MKKFIYCIVLSVFILLAVASCGGADEPGVYPNVHISTDVEFSDCDYKISGALTYTSHNNLSFSYSKPESISGFTVTMKGDVCETTFKELKRTCEGVPFSENSPIVTLLDVLKNIEDGAALYNSSGDKNESIYTVECKKESYNILSDSKTGVIKKIYNDNFSVDFK